MCHGSIVSEMNDESQGASLRVDMGNFNLSLSKSH